MRNPQRLKISDFRKIKSPCYNHIIYENKKTKELYLEKFEDDNYKAEMYVEDKTGRSWIEAFWHHWKFIWYFDMFWGLTIDKDADTNPNREYVELF